MIKIKPLELVELQDHSPDTFKIVRSNWLVNAVVRCFLKKKWIKETHVSNIQYRAYDAKSLFDLIWQQMRDYRRMTGRRPSKIIMGTEQEMEVLVEGCEKTYVSLNFSSPECPAWVLGMKMEVNPLIDGIVVTGD